MRSKASAEIFSYWNDLRGHGEAPSREQIEPAHIRSVLADLFILEAREDGDIRFRLAGTRICSLFARELRGSRFDALWAGEQAGKVDSILNNVLVQKLPVMMSAMALAGRSERLPVEVVLLPLRSGGEKVDRIIGALAPLARPLWLDATPADYLEMSGLRVLDVTGTEPFLQNRPDAALPPVPSRPASQNFGTAIRRVLHLTVFDGGRGK